MRELEYLRVVTSKSTEEDSKYAWMRTPFALKGHAVASDGHRLLAFPYSMELPESTLKPDTRKHIAEWISEPKSGVAVDPAKFTEFVGALPKREACDDCGGNGSTYRSCEYCDEGHTCECGCDGGVKPLPVRQLQIGDVLVNRWYLADLQALFAESESISILGRGPEGRLSIYSDKWSFHVMPMRGPAMEKCSITTLEALR